MKRFFSERNVAVLLFVIASACFVIAERDTRRVEKMLGYPANETAPLSPVPEITSDNAPVAKPSPGNTDVAGYR